jgi:hypothetical protein
MERAEVVHARDGFWISVRSGDRRKRSEVHDRIGSRSYDRGTDGRCVAHIDLSVGGGDVVSIACEARQ